MKILRLAYAFVVPGIASSLLWSAPAGRIPVEDFARPPEISNVSLAPNGLYMAYVFYKREVGWGAQMSFLNLATNKATRGVGNNSKSALPTNYYAWVGAQRVLIFDWSSGWTAVDCDQNNLIRVGTYGQALAGSAGFLYTAGDKPERVLARKYPEEKDVVTKYPDIELLNTLTGEQKLELKNPGNIREWMTDWEGNIRFAAHENNGPKRILSYRPDAGQPWEDLAGLDDRAIFVGVTPDGQTAFVSRPNAGDRYGLYAYDLKERKIKGLLFQDEAYDITEAIFSPKRHALLGVKYETEKPQQKWFSPLMAAIQAKVDEQFPGTVNQIISMDDEEKRLLIFSWSDQNPGFYSVLDLNARKFVPIGQRMPWIKPGQMARTTPIQCAARDGLELHGYLTRPLGVTAKNLPLVMLAHDGPWARDAWGYDSLVQFLANRGYAVLQINYRGSSGYGRKFLEWSQKEIGGVMQDDIADAVRWAIKEGTADPKRIAIMGTGYGGYSTLFALAKTPELYRCGVEISGITDWTDLLEHPDDKGDHHQKAKEYWLEALGRTDWDGDRQRLARVSPVNFAAEIKAPLLIVHGERDDYVPQTQAKALVAALENAGLKPKTIFDGFAGHERPGGESGETFLRQLEVFLEKNLGAN